MGTVDSFLLEENCRSVKAIIHPHVIPRFRVHEFHLQALILIRGKGLGNRSNFTSVYGMYIECFAITIMRGTTKGWHKC
jgi:hypothetical protein